MGGWHSRIIWGQEVCYVSLHSEPVSTLGLPTVWSLWGNPGMARCWEMSSLPSRTHPAAQSDISEQQLVTGFHCVWSVVGWLILDSVPRWWLSPTNWPIQSEHLSIADYDDATFGAGTFTCTFLVSRYNFGCANKDLWVLCALIFIIVVYCKTATSYFLGLQLIWICRPSHGPMLLLGGEEMAFVRDAIHFCYCCHSELSTFFSFSFSALLCMDATQDQRGLGANPDFHRLLFVCHQSMAIQVVEFSSGGLKNERFLPNNQHIQVFSTHFVPLISILEPNIMPLISILEPKIMEEWNNQLQKLWFCKLLKLPVSSILKIQKFPLGTLVCQINESTRLALLDFLHPTHTFSTLLC